jgi:class 3 adenylate cyclase/tetratricopeptide (TPR) repeat protein
MQSTLTVLFTDAVASTESLARLGDERFGLVQQAHLDLLRSAACGHDGREVKSLGDGLMVVFSGAADALACAIEMQQAVDAGERRGDEGLPLRIGLALGDVDIDSDGDCHGMAVVEASRICAAAGAGQVLASDTVRAVAGSRGRHVFTPLGPVELKGIEEPVPIVEVGWAPLAAGNGLAPVPLPPRLAFESAWTFVGRDDERARIDALWLEAAAGALRVALLGGEPGVGKTRLAREAAVRAHEQGALTLFGRVDEELAVAYQPFAEALRHYLASVDEATRKHVLALRGGVLARLVPELVDELPEGPVEPWAVLEGIVDWLAEEARQRPIVLVLDDLHWAATPTLAALMHLVHSERLGRLFIVGTYRDTELARTHPLAGVLADLRREEGVERLSIRGLDEAGVEAFVHAARGDTLDEESRELAGQLSEQTQGNPFFVGQVLRHLAEAGVVKEVDGRWVRAEGADGFEVPEGVREVIGRRVSRLSERAGELLTVAAVAGSEFDTAVVAEVAEQPTAQALDGFDEALRARLVLETDAPGRLRFPHALVQQTLEEELSTLRRLHVHRGLALAIERRVGEADTAVAELARHFAEAAALGEGERAAHYAERAGVQAMDRGAPDQAADLFQRALDLLPADVDPDGLRRDRLYQPLARCWWGAFDQQRVEDVSRRWLALGRELDDDIMRSNAAVWLTLSFLWRRVPDAADLAGLAEALRVQEWGVEAEGRRRFGLRATWCQTDGAGMRALLLANTATFWAVGLPLGAIDAAVAAGHPVTLAEEACRIAEDSTDPEIAGEVRYLRAWTRVGSSDAAAQLQDGERAAKLGYSFGGGGWMPAGLALARLGRLDDQRAWTDEMVLAAGRNGDRAMLGNAFVQRAMVAIARGQFDEAHDAAEQALAVRPDQVAFQVTHANLSVSRLLGSGRADEARPIADELDANPAVDSSHLVAVVAVAQGDLETPRAVLDAWRATGYELPVDLMRSGRLWGLAESAYAVGDQDAARHLYNHLTPYDGQLLIYAFQFIAASAAFTLGLLAETLGQRDRALAHYSDALSFEEGCGAETLAVRTRAALARLSA